MYYLLVSSGEVQLFMNSITIEKGVQNSIKGVMSLPTSLLQYAHQQGAALIIALLVVSIAAGASIASHVNDSGFWLVGKYLGLNEKQTFQSWSVMTTILAVTSFSIALLLSLFF